jgi:replicative DNA helicase
VNTPPEPHDTAAEQAVLGAMMLSAAAAEQCRQVLVPLDFYKPAHQVVCEALLAMMREGQCPDAVTVAAWLGEHVNEVSKRTELDMIGGAPELHTLIASVPVAANALHYARIVRGHAVMRRLREATRRVFQMTSGSDVDAHGLVERALREFEAVRDAGIGDGLTVQTITEFLGEDEDADAYDWVIEDLLERCDRLILTGVEGAGKALALDTPIPTPKGWTTMGELTVGQEVFAADGTPTEVVFATPVMTGHPCYRITFSDGAQIVADADHQWLTETLKAREADAKYRKKPATIRLRGTDQKHKRLHFPAVVTTRQIAETLRARDGHALNHSIRACAPLQYPAQELLIAPYTLGAWLGDGTSQGATITCADPGILEQIKADGYEIRHVEELLYRITNKGDREKRVQQALDLIADGMGVVRAARYVGVTKEVMWAVVGTRHTGYVRGYEPHAAAAAHPYRPLQTQLRELGVLQNKHIPATYLHASVEQRLALLAGLMDTDGTVSAEGKRGGRGFGAATCEFSVCSERLARDVQELLLGLGVKVTFREGPAVLQGRRVGTRYRLSFQTELPVFRLKRKAERLARLRTRRAMLRYITAVEPVESVPVRCIQVAHPGHLYLAGHECIPTHNTHLLRFLAVSAAAGFHPFTLKDAKPARVLFIDCENTPRHTRRKMRPLVTQARLQGHPVDESNLWIECRPQGMDLAQDKDVSWLLRQVAAVVPDITFLGPLYRLAPRALQTDDEAAPVIATLNMIRARGSAVVLEAHAGHATGPGGKRDPRPRGSSAFLGWPEFGYGLRWADGEFAREERALDLVSWRGDRDERNWPEGLAAGGTWPWRVRPHAVRGGWGESA